MDQRKLETRSQSCSREEVRTFLVKVLEEVARIPVEKITDSSTVDGDLRMESVAFIEVQVALEDHYEIELDPVQMVELNTLAAIIDYLYARVSESNK